MTARRRQLLLIGAIILTVLVLDQASKAAIRHHFEANEVSFLHEEPRFFQLTHQENPHLSWGLLRNWRWAPFLAPLLASAVMVYLYRYLDVRSWLQSVAYGMVVGGAIGNLIDRFRLGHVTDFLLFNFYFVPFDLPSTYFPPFNVADTGICTGVFILIVTWYWTKEEEEHASDPV